MHFTYQIPASGDLEQGDLLRNDGRLRDVIHSVHPHYLNESYTHFILLTQSCDLVRRGSDCKSRYLTLAAVRPLQIVLEREIANYQDALTKAARICSLASRDRVAEYVRRLLNNNNMEYFYLHENPETGLTNSCAFLRLSVSIRAYEHYEECLESRTLSLEPTFQAKLGWLVGNVYSRVGTADWVPLALTKREFSGMVEQLLNENIAWIDEAKIKAAKKVIPDPSQFSEDKIRQKIDELQVLPRKERVLGVTEEVLRAAGLNDPDLRRLIVRLRNNPEFSSLLK